MAPPTFATTGERPEERFERKALGPLAPKPYRRLGTAPRLLVPVKVQQRPLSVYAEVVR